VTIETWTDPVHAPQDDKDRQGDRPVLQDKEDTIVVEETAAHLLEDVEEIVVHLLKDAHLLEEEAIAEVK
jgi:hypothetical protein